jgi:uncharacterized membrane protein YhaH (DUF805 family)
MSETAADGGGPGQLLRSSFFLKTIVFVVLLVVAGIAAPPLFPENEFVGVFVGMVWSIAFLIILVAVVAVVGSAVRQALR